MDINAGQLWVILLAIIGIVSWIVYACRYRDHWLVAIAPLTYFFHVLVFNFWAELGGLTPVQINNWSHAVRLHSELLFIFMALILLDRRTSKWI